MIKTIKQARAALSLLNPGEVRERAEREVPPSVCIEAQTDERGPVELLLSIVTLDRSLLSHG